MKMINIFVLHTIILSSMEMFYNTDLLLNNNLNRDMILKRFEKSSKSEKTLIRIAMNYIEVV